MARLVSVRGIAVLSELSPPLGSLLIFKRDMDFRFFIFRLHLRLMDFHENKLILKFVKQRNETLGTSHSQKRVVTKVATIPEQTHRI